jgi:hypothetical protein
MRLAGKDISFFDLIIGQSLSLVHDHRTGNKLSPARATSPDLAGKWRIKIGALSCR